MAGPLKFVLLLREKKKLNLTNTAHFHPQIPSAPFGPIPWSLGTCFLRVFVKVECRIYRTPRHFRSRVISWNRRLPPTVQRVLALGTGALGACAQFLALSTYQLCDSTVPSPSGPQHSLLQNGSVAPLCGNILKPLEGAGGQWASEALEILLLDHLLCLCCVTGPRGHAWAARISSKYHSNHLPSVYRGCAHSVPSTWNALLLHLRDKAVAPSCSCNFSSLFPTWSDPISVGLYFHLCCLFACLSFVFVLNKSYLCPCLFSLTAL